MKLEDDFIEETIRTFYYNQFLKICKNDSLSLKKEKIIAELDEYKKKDKICNFRVPEMLLKLGYVAAVIALCSCLNLTYLNNKSNFTYKSKYNPELLAKLKSSSSKIYLKKVVTEYIRKKNHRGLK